MVKRENFTSTESQDRFDHTVLSYGTDPARWPENLYQDLEHQLGPTELKRCLRQAYAVQEQLDKEVITEPSGDYMARLMSIPDQAQADRVRSGWLVSLFADLFGLPELGSAPGLALQSTVLALVFVAGLLFSGSPDAFEDADTIDLMTYWEASDLDFDFDTEGPTS